MNLSIDKHGNPRVRAVLVELAWLLPRYQPDYKPLARWKWVFDERSKASAAMKKKAVVALARHLAVDLWRIKTGRANPVDLGLKLAA
jgi:transposase